MGTLWTLLKTSFFAVISVGVFSIFIITEIFMVNEVIDLLHNEYGVVTLYSYTIPNFLDFIPQVEFLPLTLSINLDAIIFLSAIVLIIWGNILLYF